MEKILLDKILEELGLIPTEIAIKKPPITFASLIESLILGGSISKAADILSMSDSALEHQISRNLKQYLPNKPKTTPWDIILLDLVSSKRCPKCNNIKAKELFGSRSECKECANILQKRRHKLDPKPGNERSRNHYKNNKGEYIARNINRRLHRKLVTPPWANLVKIKEIYNNCPIGYHVDHIIPLRGKNISGLHVETNLQYLPAKDNLEKSNKYIDQ